MEKSYIGSDGGSGNIYSNGYFDKVKQIEYSKASSTMELGQLGLGSGVVPYFFNTISQTGTKKIKNPNYNPSVLQTKIARLIADGRINSSTQLSTSHPQIPGNSILSIGNAVGIGGIQSSANGTGDMDTVTGVHAMNEFGTSENFSTLITKAIGPPPIPPTHNNMVPFIGGSVKQNTYAENRQQDGKLESYTGQFKLDQNHKREENTLFAPIQQDIMPLQSPREMDRYSNSLTVRNGEIPFEKTHVGKGLNEGYTATPSGGFHNDVRPLPKNIDQLLINPKETYKGRIVKGKHMVDKRTAEQGVYKYAPEVLVDNTNGQWNRTTKGVATGPTSRAQIVQRDTNRKCNRVIFGPARDTTVASKALKDSMRQKVKQSEKVTFLGVIMGAVQSVGKQFNDILSTYHVDETSRQQTQEKFATGDHRGGAHESSAIANQIYHTDPTRQTQAQTYRTTNPSDGRLGVSQYQGQAYDPTQLTRTTNRQMIEQNSKNGQLAVAKYEGQAYDPTQLARTTGRQTIEQNAGNGQLAVAKYEGQAFDPSQIARTTGRQTIEQNAGNGQLAVTKFEGQAFDPSQIARTTGRQTIEQNAGNGQLAVTKFEGQAYDPSQIARTTGRQTIEQNAGNGQLAVTRYEGQAYDPTQITRTTGRQTIEQNAGNGQLAVTRYEGQAYDPTQLTRTTGRQTIEQNAGNGQLAVSQYQGQAYDPLQKTRTTGRQTIEQNTKNGQLSVSQYQGQAYDPTQKTRATGRQTIENNTHIAGVKQSFGHITYDPFDVTRTTARELTEDSDYLGIVSGVANGDGYKTAPKDINDTQRQTYSDTEHFGGAEGDVAPQLYDSAYSMRQNVINEVIDSVAGRGNGPSGAKRCISGDDLYMTCSKQDVDRMSQYSSVPKKFVVSTTRPSNNVVGELTSCKNIAKETNIYYDTDIIHQLDHNSLNIDFTPRHSSLPSKLREVQALV